MSRPDPRPSLRPRFIAATVKWSEVLASGWGEFDAAPSSDGCLRRPSGHGAGSFSIFDVGAIDDPHRASQAITRFQSADTNRPVQGTMPSTTIVTIDFEGSSLHGYPIEVGVAQ